MEKKVCRYVRPLDKTKHPRNKLLSNAIHLCVRLEQQLIDFLSFLFLSTETSQ